MDFTKILLCIILLAGLAFIAFALGKARKDEENLLKKVKENSPKLTGLNQLNEQLNLLNIKNKYVYFEDFNDKRNSIDEDYFIKKIVTADVLFFENLIVYANHNYDQYALYLDNVKRLENTSKQKCEELGVDFSEFVECEAKLFDRNLVSYNPNVKIICYTKFGVQEYSLFDIKRIIDDIDWERQEKEEKDKEIKSERAKMSPSLRYDILKRDGFRCQICGASQKDGVRLHVDHIVPVSKGGKTEVSNLRTLCEKCNLGKGAKME